MQGKWLEMLQSEATSSIFQPPTGSWTSGGATRSAEENEVSSISARYHNNDRVAQRRTPFSVYEGNRPKWEAETRKRPFFWLQPLVPPWGAWYLEWDAQCIALTTIMECVLGNANTVQQLNLSWLLLHGHGWLLLVFYLWICHLMEILHCTWIFHHDFHKPGFTCHFKEKA